MSLYKQLVFQNNSQLAKTECSEWMVKYVSQQLTMHTFYCLQNAGHYYWPR